MANIQSGKAYKLTNAKGGTVLDLSGGQERGPITGYSPNGGDNQKWVFEDSNGRYKIKTANGLYIGFEGDPTNGTPVIGLSNGAEWEVKPDQKDSSVFRIFLAGQQYCLDLSDHGNSNPGTPVTLWKKWEGGSNQTWRFEDA